MQTVSPGTRFDYAVYCGTQSPFRKFTVQCIDAEGHARFYVKVSDGARSPAAIRREAEVLDDLSRLGFARGRVPELVGTFERWGRTISVQRAPDGVPKRAPFLPSPAIVDFARRLFESTRHAEPWATSPVRSRILASAARLRELGESSAACLLEEGVSILQRRFGESPIPHGRVHGDFLPWNVRVNPSAYVFDWEWSGIGLPLADLFHYVCFDTIRRTRKDIALRLRQRIGSSQVRQVLNAGLPVAGKLEYPKAEWWLAYLLRSFSFYGETTAAQGGAVAGSTLLNSLSVLLRAEISGQVST
jgi:hypothetical protein